MRRIDALTSLRFFAAAMIVVHHWSERFSPALHHVPFASGVSFFFVLSGFVIATAYPAISTARQFKHFLGARFARLYPLHLLTFCIAGIALLAGYKSAAYQTFGLAIPALANLTLAQSLVPVRDIYFSFNAVSWSISTEAGFYLLYPAVALLMPGSMKLKLLLAMTFSVSGYLLLSSLVSPASIAGREAMNWFVYIFPLARFWEFMLGVCLANQASESTWPFKGAQTKANRLQFVALAALLAGYAGLAAYSGLAGVDSDTGPLYLWLFSSGMAPLYALLIFAFSGYGGCCGVVLGRKGWVYLGEVSFALYLVHRLVLNGLPFIYRRIGLDDRFMGTVSGFVVYALMSLVLATAMHELVELPSQRRLRIWVNARWS